MHVHCRGVNCVVSIFGRVRYWRFPVYMLGTHMCIPQEERIMSIYTFCQSYLSIIANRSRSIHDRNCIGIQS